MQVHRLAFMTDGLDRALTWNDVIGFRTGSEGSDRVNLLAEVSGASGTTLTTQLASRAPNFLSSETTLLSPRSVTLARRSPQPSWARHPVYTAALNLSPLGFGAEPKGLATVVRPGDDATSDRYFRTAVGDARARRGVAVQPTTVGATTGDEGLERPDARVLMRAGGVEVLEATLAVPGGRPVKAKRLIRSPAWVFYYSGHGLSGNGSLALQVGSGYPTWLGGGELVAAWANRIGPRVLVIAGCSVLKPTDVAGRTWMRLLSTHGGPCSTLLGYDDSAPLDSQAGNGVAGEIGRTILRGLGSDDLVREWLSINGRRRQWNACAINTRGYWAVDPSRFLGVGPASDFDASRDIKGPTPL